MGRFRRARTLFHGFTTLIVVNFVLNLHNAMVAFVHSPLLGQFYSTEVISLLYIVQSSFLILTLLLVPTIIGFIGPRSLLITLIPVVQFAVLFFGIAKDPVSATFFFMLHAVALWTIFYLLDLYVEGMTKDEGKTGGIRASFLTAANLAIFLGPLAVVFLVAGTYYAPLYAASALVVVPAFALALTAFSKLPTRAPKKNAFREAFQTLSCCRPGVVYAIASQFLLRTFYAWTGIYAPLYLIYTVGLSWQVVGTLITFAMFAFVLLEIPLGILADRYFGEKEIMTIGFIILGIATALLSFVPVTPIVWWGLVFFITRIGAAMVEITSESHFFKRVNETDSGLVSLFRIMNPLAFIVGPALGILFLFFVPLQYLFAFCGVILLFGATLSMRIIDTK